MWYDQPQREVIDALPEGVRLMCDFERGGLRHQDVGDVAIDEYSLGYAGPSERFAQSREASKKRDLGVCAKLQIGTTHELATVPNLPLMGNLFEKLARIDEFGLDGMMCSWNFGNSPSLNTAAFKMFVDRSDLRRDKVKFLHTLAGEYLQACDSTAVTDAWQLFCDSFGQYPFSIKMLYFSPMNYAVAYPLKLDYEDQPMGPAWIFHEPWGDRLEDCYGPFTIKQICQCFATMEKLWDQGLELYDSALSATQNGRALEELSCAKMIGCHLAAMRNIFEFHQHRRAKMKELGLEGPCPLPADRETTAAIQRQKQICQRALNLLRLDGRFGYHQEPHAYFYDEKAIQSAIAQSS